MSIVNTMNQSQFVDAMGNDFSYEASQALYDYYENLSDDLGEPFEFDRVAIRCDWYEYDNMGEAWDDLGNGTDIIEGEELAIDDNVELWLESNTQIIELGTGGVLVQAF